MKRIVWRLMLSLLLVVATSMSASAQGTSSSLSGTVTDSGGGVIPGATVAVKNNATSVVISVVTNSAGVFSVPALEPGTYTVTVSLSGFKTSVSNDVRMISATPSSLKVVLEVGQLTEIVTVLGGSSELVQTTSPIIATTINVDQLNKLPLPTRNALNFVTFLPGVETTGIARDSTINGLSQSTISITMDGVNIQDNHNKTTRDDTDGFFARVYPRQDAVEQVTVTSAAQGADSAGQGAVQIRFATRSGTNKFDTSLYHYYRSPRFNTNYFFNKKNGLEKNRVILHQYGGRLGGPIVLPGIYDGHGKAFFFFNHEEFYNPSEATRTRTIMRPSAQAGIFAYNVTAGGVTTTRTVDILAMAAAGGFTSTIDPTIGALLADIRASTAITGVVSDLADPNTQRFVFQNAGAQRDHQPTVKIDYNLGLKHRISGSYTWLHVLRDPDFLNSADPAFPKFPNYRTQDSYRPSGAVNFRSTFGANMVNEFVFGGSWGPTSFGGNLGLESFANQGGYQLGISAFPNNSSITNPTISNGPSARAANSWNIDNTFNWQRGSHSFSFGGGVSQIRTWLESDSVVPALSFSIPDENPASSMFSTASPFLTGASQGQVDDAEDLYAVLTGSVSAVNGTARLNAAGRYEYLAPLVNRVQLTDFGTFAQDSWRVRPNLTLSAGVRWQLQLPFGVKTGVMSTASFADLCGISGVAAVGKCNIFKPGTLTGIRPQFIKYEAGTKGYNTDWNNFAPNLGFAWQPNVETGLLRTILGDPAQATVRGGYSVGYTNNGTGIFSGVYAANPGDTVNANRTSGNGNLLQPGQTWPVLLRQGASVLGPPATCPEGVVSAACMQFAPIFPIISTSGSDINLFDPNLQVSFSRSYTIGLQRSIGRNTAVEVRYVGTRNVKGWTNENWNETNIIENNFLNEFRNAQANLYANQAAGRGATLAYFGPGTGTVPLPTYFGYIVGAGNPNVGGTANYTGTLWTNGTLVGRHALNAPSPVSAADDVWNNATRRANAVAAGLPVNHFRLNPDAGEANIVQSESFSKYHSMQTEVRRRFSRGLAFNFNWTWSRRWGSSNLGQRYGRILARSTGNPHSFRTTWNYEVPVGQGRRFGANMPLWLDAIAGGWSFDGTGRFQTRTVNLGNVRVVGMSLEELQKEYYIRIDDATKTVTMLPADIILNTRRAYGSSATAATGYGTLGVPENRYIAPANNANCYQLKSGDCAPLQTFLNAPMFSRFDMSLKKKFRVVGKATFDVVFDVLNVFDNINFNPVANPGNGATIFEVTSAYQDSSNTFDPGGRLGQITWRISW